MIKAIIFDLFGVIVTEGLTSFKDTYFASKPELRKKAHKLTDDFNGGLIGMSYDDYFIGLAELAGTDRETVAKYLNSEQPNQLLINFIAQNLKPKFKVGILSNAGNDWTNKLLDPVDIALFDEIVLSHKIKLIKPNPEFYILIAKNLGVEPQECVYIDDNQKYCDGAAVVGMYPILYKDFTSFKRQLNELLLG